MKRRRVLGGVVLLLALAGVGWLLVESDVFGATTVDEDERIADDEALEDAMTVDVAKKGDEAPKLEGREGPTPDPSAGRGSVEVLVVGPGNVPLPGVALMATDEAQINLDDVTSGLDDDVVKKLQVAADRAAAEKAKAGTVALPKKPTATTDADGKAFFKDLPYDGTWRIETMAPAGSFKVDRATAFASVLIARSGSGGGDSTPVLKALLGGQAASVAVKGPEAELKLRRGMPVRLVEVSAATDSVFEPGPWALAPAVGQPGKRELRHLPYQTARVAPGGRNGITVYAADHSGFVPDRLRRYRAWISPLARELIAYLPQRPEADLMVTLPEGVPMRAGKDWRVKYRVDGRTRGTATAHIDSFGRVLVKGVPFLPGQQVRLDGKIKKEGRLFATGRFGTDGRDQLVLDAVWHPYKRITTSNLSEAAELAKKRAAMDRMQQELAAKLAAMEAETVAIQRQNVELKLEYAKAQAAAREADRGGSTGSGRDAAEAKNLVGEVRVFVRRRDGKPAAGASVMIGNQAETLSAKGRAAFDALQPADYDVRVMGAGVTFLAKVTVVAGETATLELDAPIGGTVDVEVVDGEGRGLPCAEVYITQPSGLLYSDVSGPVQRIDPFTDHVGRRTFENVEAGEVTVTAVYGSRKDKVTVQVPEAHAALARIVLPTPEDPKAKKTKKAKNPLGGSPETVKRLKDSAARLKEVMRALKEARKREKEGR